MAKAEQGLCRTAGAGEACHQARCGLKAQDLGFVVQRDLVPKGLPKLTFSGLQAQALTNEPFESYDVLTRTHSLVTIVPGFFALLMEFQMCFSN